MSRPRSVPLDTSPEVFEMLVERWREMTLDERVALIDQVNADVEHLAIAGIRHGHPELTDREVRHELARRRYGARLADEAYATLRS